MYKLERARVKNRFPRFGAPIPLMDGFLHDNAQLPLHAQLYADSSIVRSIDVIARLVAATDRPHLVVYDRSDYRHCMIAPLPPFIGCCV